MTTLRLLLKAGADVNAHGIGYYTALSAAFLVENGESVSVLLDAGADVNMSAWVKTSPLRVAAKIKNYDNVMKLLDYGALIDADLGTEEEYTKEFHTSRRIASELLRRKTRRS